MARKEKKGRKNKNAGSRVKAGKAGIFIGHSYWISYLPVVLALIITPLIVRSVEYYNYLSRYPWDRGNIYQVDLFLRGKGFALYLFAGLAVFLALCMVLTGKRFRLYSIWLLIPLLYLMLAFFSAAFSRYKDISFRGAPDLHQHFPVLSAYLILFYYTFFLTAADNHDKSTEENVQIASFILKGFLILSIMLCIIGLLQVAGQDPFTWTSVRKLCGIDEAKYVASSRIYMSLYHPDYVGVMTVMLLPMIIAGCFVEKKKVVRIIYGITALFLFVCLIASQSRTGVIALVMTGCVFFVISFEKTKRYKVFGMKLSPYLLMLVLPILLAGLAVLVDQAFLSGSLSGRLFKVSENYTADNKGISGIETGDQEARIIIDGKTYFLSWAQDNDFRMVDSAGGELHLTSCTDEEYREVKDCLKKEKVEAEVSQEDIQTAADSQNIPVCYLIKVRLENKQGKMMTGCALCDGKDVWLICKDLDENGYRLMNRQGKTDKSIISDDSFPESFYGFASFRGYIWSKTIAKIGNVVLIGTGPDTFSLFFPNNDYVSRHRTGQDDILVNKPHCWYLQMAAETGIFSSLSVIVYLIYFFIYIFKSQFVSTAGTKEPSWIFISDSPAAIMSLAAGLSVFAYVVTGLANDSMVVCAPIFWILLGYGSGLMLGRSEK